MSAVLRESGALDRVSASSRLRLESAAKRLWLRRGEHLFHDRDEISAVYFVASGMVSLYKINSLGERRVVFTLGPGSLLNETIGERYLASINCQTIQDSTIIAIDAKELLDIASGDFGLARGLLDALSGKVRRLYRQIKNASGSLRGDKRLAAKLWKLALDYGVSSEDGVRIDMKLSVTYLSEMLGVQRETVSRQLGTLASLGLVEVRDGVFRVPNTNALAEYFKDIPE